MTVPAKRSVILVTTHFVDGWIRRKYQRLLREKPANFDLFLLVRTEEGTDPAFGALPSVCASHADLRRLGYPAKGMHGTNIPLDYYYAGHVDLPLLSFYRQHPNYRNYWNIEYDVDFSGSWSAFFAATEASASDLLTASLRRRADDPQYPFWDTFVPPGPGAIEEEGMLCGFLPVFRASARALALVDDAYRRGCTGHLEIVWPTLLAAAGLPIEDFGGEGPFVRPGNRNRFYTNTPLARSLSPGSLVFKPVRFRPGPTPYQLWHPVKPFARTVLGSLKKRAGRASAALSKLLLLTLSLRSGPPVE